MEKPIIIATRASPLAKAQSESVARLLRERLGRECQLLEISTKGDRILDQPLADIGGKGLFTAELDAALKSGAADIAVHSLKDLPTSTNDGLITAAILPRATPFDVLLGRVKTIGELKQGAVVGTASLRRGAQILALRPDIKLTPTRGNINTRIEKLAKNIDALDAIILAAAGLERLSPLKLPANIFATQIPPELMLPAAGQGALAIQTASANNKNEILSEAIAGLACATTTAAVSAERAALAALDGSCRTPIAAYAHINNKNLDLRVKVLAQDGSEVAEAGASGNVADAIKLGQAAAAEIRANAPHLLFFDKK